jgi:hypothetical protein
MRYVERWARTMHPCGTVDCCPCSMYEVVRVVRVVAQVRRGSRERVEIYIILFASWQWQRDNEDGPNIGLD